MALEEALPRYGKPDHASGPCCFVSDEPLDAVARGRVLAALMARCQPLPPGAPCGAPGRALVVVAGVVVKAVVGCR